MQRVLNEYPRHYVSGGPAEPLTGHPVAALVAHTMPDQLRAVCKDTGERYLFKGSVGAGNWARLPWIAVFDVLVTNTAQEGYYPVYLFCEDFSGVYLSLNQGVTTIGKQYKSQAIEALRTRAQDFQAQLDNDTENFELGPIDLKRVRLSKYAAQYEAGNICSVFYKSGNIPNDEILKHDLLTVLRLYDVLTYSDTSTLPVAEDIGLQSKDYEDLRKMRFHSRVERNQNSQKRLKSSRNAFVKPASLTLVQFMESWAKAISKHITSHRSRN